MECFTDLKKKKKNDLLTISVLKTKRVTIHVHCTQESCRYCKERGSVTKNDVAATCNSRAKHFVLTIPTPHLQASARFFRHKSNISFFHYKSNYLLLSPIKLCRLPGECSCTCHKTDSSPRARLHDVFCGQSFQCSWQKLHVSKW